MPLINKKTLFKIKIIHKITTKQTCTKPWDALYLLIIYYLTSGCLISFNKPQDVIFQVTLYSTLGTLHENQWKPNLTMLAPKVAPTNTGHSTNHRIVSIHPAGQWA